MKNRITTLIDKAETQKPNCFPMREILEELFNWCQTRFPQFRIIAVETPVKAF
jgi:hypothetical protein